MSDIFLSYASEDLARIKPLAAALSSEGWTVFYDRTIPPGMTWRQFIGKEIEQCRCLVVCWSSHSVASHWVIEEADIGLKRHVLIPLFLDRVSPPLGFGSIQAANLVEWQQKSDAQGYRELRQAIIDLIGPGLALTLKSDASYMNAEPRPVEFDVPRFLAQKKPAAKKNLTNTVRRKWFKGKAGTIMFPAAALSISAVVWTLQIDQYAPHNLSEENSDFKQEPNSAVAEQSVAKNSSDEAKPKTMRQTTTVLKSADPGKIKEPEMVRIPSGRFQMGSNDGSEDEKPVHTVNLKSFFISRYEVTFDEYDQFAEAVGKPKPDDLGWGRGRVPVINASWVDASAYAAWLSEQTGKRYRLPTEAEWEYAARAGSSSEYHWGQNDPGGYAWYSDNSGDKTHPVGQKQPNAFGLYDMAGNVWEWVEDCRHDDYQNTPADGKKAWLKEDGGDCGAHVLRGGSWNSNGGDLRSAYRNWKKPGNRTHSLGFRLAQDSPFLLCVFTLCL